MGNRKGPLSGWTIRREAAGAVLITAALLSTAAQADEARCAALTGKTLAASEIGLPTGGAKAAGAEFVAAKAPMPAYCKVLGAIAPVDPMSTPILFELNLPDGWNGKALQFGGGGLNGQVANGLGRLRDAPPDVPVPLAQHYATFGSDSGHPGAGQPDLAKFAWNEEALDNYLKSAPKKTHDVALALVAAYYGEKAYRTYYFGGSQGGREAMNAIQNFPADYDGAVATVPVIGWGALEAAAYNQWEAAYRNNFAGRPTPASLQLMRNATLAVCDEADGLKDGVVSHVEACKGPDLAALHCKDDKAADDCLTNAQTEHWRRVHSPLKFGYTVINGSTDYPAWMWGAGETLADGTDPWMANKGPPDMEAAKRSIGVAFARYFLEHDPDFTGPLDLKKNKAKFVKISALGDMTNPDLSAFVARGGKLLMKENGSDYVQNPKRGIAYYNAVVAKLGQTKVDSFMRIYLNPGVDHGGSGKQLDGSPVPDKVDLLGALDAWVDKGQTPRPLLVTAFEGTTPGATRPLCRYPLWPKYDGKGDPKLAASFACVK